MAPDPDDWPRCPDCGRMMAYSFGGVFDLGGEPAYNPPGTFICIHCPKGG